MIDYHCHILPGLDDGSAHVDESVAMARALAAAGYRQVYCTPHCIMGSYWHSPDRVREATLMLQADLDNAGVALELVPGMEYYLDEYLLTFTESLVPLGKTRLLLCEAPSDPNPELVVRALQHIIAQGFIPLVAHPERTQFFYETLRLEAGGWRLHKDSLGVSDHAASAGPEGKGLGRWLKRLFSSSLQPPASSGSKSHAAGAAKSSAVRLPPEVLYQANLGSFVGFYPTGTMERAYQLLKTGAFHCLATDLHNAPMAERMLKSGIEKLETNPLLKTLADRTPDDLYQCAEDAVQKAEKEQKENEAKQERFDF